MLFLFITPPTHSVPGKRLAQNRFLVNVFIALINGSYANRGTQQPKIGGYFLDRCEAEGKSESQ